MVVNAIDTNNINDQRTTCDVFLVAADVVVFIAFLPLTR